MDNYIEDLGWNRLGLHPSEMIDVMEDREFWWFNHELLPPQHSGRKRAMKKEEEAIPLPNRSKRRRVESASAPAHSQI